MGEWILSHGGEARALAIVDGLGPFAKHGPHYSRRTPGSRSFTGVGREVVLVHSTGNAVWSCIYQRVPFGKNPGMVWRNNVFRNLGAGLSSALIRSALDETYTQWVKRYGALPVERLRTEVLIKRASRNPGYCYRMAGWERGPTRRGAYGPTLHLYAPLVRP